MNSDSQKKRKVSAIIWPIIYSIVVLCCCASFCYCFNTYYFEGVYVSGFSMYPTLNHVEGYLTGKTNNYRHDFGIIDTHDSAVDSIKRFDVITTYFPFSPDDYAQPYVKGSEVKSSAAYKIKRVYGLPGESIKMTVDSSKLGQLKNIDSGSKQYQDVINEAISFYVSLSGQEEWEALLNIDFKRFVSPGSTLGDFTYTLGENEYWVMGDNYTGSNDCRTNMRPVYRENITGVLVAIEGTCLINSSSSYDHAGNADNCYDKQYHWPKFY